MASEKKYHQVFVSSTYEDLKEERAWATQTLLENDCIPVGMELFPASNRSPWDVIKKDIDKSDFYLLIIGGRYGSVCKDGYGKKVSYTEREFDYAKEQNKLIIVFVHSEDELLPKEKREKTSIGERRLKKFIKKASDQRTVSYWDSKKNNLRGLIANAIREAKSELPSDVGFVRIETKPQGNLPSAVTPHKGGRSLVGSWKITHAHNGVEYLDRMDILEYDLVSDFFKGTVKRLKPKPQTYRFWEVQGVRVGENISVLYYSQEAVCVGCALVRHKVDRTYSGHYLRYNYGTKDIDILRDIILSPADASCEPRSE